MKILGFEFTHNKAVSGKWQTTSVTGENYLWHFGLSRVFWNGLEGDIAYGRLMFICGSHLFTLERINGKRS